MRLGKIGESARYQSMIRYLLFLFLLLQSTVFSLNIDFKGHVDHSALNKASEEVQNAASSDKVIITIDSNSADLAPVLEFSKVLFQAKAEKGFEVIVYLNDEVIGPMAMIPFLADERYGSPYLSWGDIRFGSEGDLPANILRKQVAGFISKDQPPVLLSVAASMSDPSIIFNQSGVTSSANEALVLNQNEIVQLGLVKELLSLNAFQLLYPNTSKIEQVQAAPVKDFDRSLAEHIKFNPQGSNKIGYLRIVGHNDQISQATWIYIKKALEYYKESKPAFIILELDTPGGEVFAAQKISDALKAMDTQEGIPVVTFINNWAISAGAMLAYSTRYITSVKDGSMGAAEPVIAGEGGKMESASEKINSALRADFANRAAFFDRNPSIAEAMVDKDVILVYRNGKVVKLDSEEAIRRTGPNPDEIISAKGKLLTLNASQMVKYGVADLMLTPEKISVISDQELAQGTWPADKMLLFQYPFFKNIPDATIDMYIMDWKTQFLALISSPMVSSLLFLGMMLGFYIEFNTPGFGLPGTVALTCLLLIIIASFALEIGNILELILLLIGVGMLLAELFVLPGFGLMGILGIIFFIAGVVSLMLPNLGSFEYEFETGTVNLQGEFILQRLAWIAGTFVLGIIIMGILGKYFLPSFTGYSRLVLRGGEQEGYYAGDAPEKLPKPGERGVVTAALRPAGKIEVNGLYYDAMTLGDFIKEKTPIIIKNVSGNIIYVDKEDA